MRNITCVRRVGRGRFISVHLASVPDTSRGARQQQACRRRRAARSRGSSCAGSAAATRGDSLSGPGSGPMSTAKWTKQTTSCGLRPLRVVNSHLQEWRDAATTSAATLLTIAARRALRRAVARALDTASFRMARRRTDSVSPGLARTRSTRAARRKAATRAAIVAATPRAMAAATRVTSCSSSPATVSTPGTDHTALLTPATLTHRSRESGSCDSSCDGGCGTRADRDQTLGTSIPCIGAGS